MRATALRFQRDQFTLGPLQFDFSEPGLHLVLGKNGSGKSTLLKILAGRLKADGAWEASPEKWGCVGLEPVFFLHWKVDEFIDWYQNLAQLPWVHREFLDALDFRKSRRIQSLSTGQKRQLELSLQLGLGFQQYLLDEAFHPLDPEAKTTYKNFLSQRISEGARVIFAAHEASQSPLEPKGVLHL